jgi:hypothetical protein
VRTLLVDQRRWDSLIGVANRLMAGRSGFESRQDQKYVSALNLSTLSVGTSELSTAWVLELFRGRKTSGS